MPVYVGPTNQTQRGGKTRSLGAVLGFVDQPSKRPVLFGRFTMPTLGFDARMQWLAKVQRLVAQWITFFPLSLVRHGPYARHGAPGIAERTLSIARHDCTQ